MSRLMLNLHSAASAGILSAPTLDTSSGAEFTSRMPDNLPFAMDNKDTDFEMQVTRPTQSLQAGAEYIVPEEELHGIMVERRSNS